MSKKCDNKIFKWIKLAVEHHQHDRLDDAERLYRRVLRKKSANPEALHFLGLLKFHRGDVEESTALIRRAVTVQPDYADAHANLGRILNKSGDNEAAMRSCREAIRLREDHADAHFNLGVCLLSAEKPAEAITALKRADELKPGNVHTYLQLAYASNKADQIEDACTYYYKAIEVDASQSMAYENLGVMLYARGHIDEAAEIYRRWLDVEPDNPKASHMYSACNESKPPPRASDEYVVSVFNQFAASYDEKLALLSYQGPQIVATAVSEIVAPGDPVGILDAGCGTGLCGPLLRPFASTLDGVDLSDGMVEKARALQVYDELVVAELVAFMRTRSAAYDVVVSADTLNYFGDLVDPIAATETCLRPGGWLVFTLEAHAGCTEDYSLNAHGRYSHSQDYIESVLTPHGYDVASIAHVELRVENKVPVDGLLITARLRNREENSMS